MNQSMVGRRRRCRRGEFVKCECSPPGALFLCCHTVSSGDPKDKGKGGIRGNAAGWRNWYLEWVSDLLSLQRNQTEYSSSSLSSKDHRRQTQ